MPFTTQFQPIAHRGGALEAQENSLQAFHHAASLGYRYMETDMQVSADGEIYLFHDDTLERVSNGKGVFSDYKASEIDKLRLHNDEPIPRLADALAELPEAAVEILSRPASTEGDVAPCPIASDASIFGSRSPRSCSTMRSTDITTASLL